MKKGIGFIYFMLILCAVMIAAGTYFIVKSVDLLRFETEKLRAAIQEMPLVPQVMQGVSAAGANTVQNNNIANLKYYDQRAQRGGRFVSVSFSDTKNMNSLITNDAFLSSLSSYVQDSLTERNFEDIGKFEPMLAESWERLDGGLRFRIRLGKCGDDRSRFQVLCGCHQKSED